MKTTFELRPWQTTDLEDLVKYANNPNISKNLTNGFPSPYTIADGERFIKMASGQQPAQIMAIAIDGVASGGVGIHPQTDIFHKNAELGYWLAEPFWGKGIMTKAIKEMVDYTFKNFEINRIFARPFGSNIGSQRVLEKVGFELEARLSQTIFKNNSYEDELIYGIRK
ncbi:MAG: GNAT family N-acetyltransferase [Saprospiraceae bacterium]